MLTVYRQAEPIPTGEKLYAKPDPYTGRSSEAQWCRANLVKVGEVETWDQAKHLCVAPVVEAKR